ncbi:MAG TPA: ABC transporter ATP-binding protein [Ignavibacteria bacterium]|nr:ABC transporter ATP-binding protein [Ignavibacteria bacterium]
MIIAENLVKIYPNNVKALDNVSFRIEQGEICGYIGTNGAGKSTTIKILAGIHNATSGNAVINNYSIIEHPEKVKHFIGYVPESGDLFLSLSAFDFLEFVCRMYDIDKNTYINRIYSFAEMFGLKNEINTPMFSYSKGMRQKVLIISSLIHNPDVIFWDEPLGGVDYSTTLQIRELMKELSSMGKTFFYSTHHVESIEKICSRIIMLNEGKVVYDSNVSGDMPVEDIFKKYAIPGNAEKISTIFEK